MGRAWAKNLIACPGVQLAGWVDVLKDRVTGAAAELGLNVSTGNDLEAAIEQLAPDFVVDVTSPEAHHEVTLLALRHGLPVLGEKPMAASMTEARELVRASEEAGALFMVSQNRRYNPQLAAMRRLIGAHAEPLIVLLSDFYLGPRFGGFREGMASPLLLDMAIHTFDAARYLSASDPVSVYCSEFNPPWSWYRGNACANAIFTMTGGVRYLYRGSWCARGHVTRWDGRWRAEGRTTVSWDGATDPTVHLAARDDLLSEEPERIDTNVRRDIAGSLHEFLDALDSGRTPMGECHDNIKSLAMVFAALESAATQQPVSIEL